MKVLLVGFGSIGHRHRTNLSALGCDVSIHDPPKDMAVKDWSGFDAAVIASPSDYHVEQALAALKNGIPAIYVEKPPAKDFYAWRSVVDAATSANAKVAVGFNWRFHPGADLLRQRVPLAWIQFSALDDFFHWPSVADHLRSDGLLWTSVSHTVDLATSLVGPLHPIRGDAMFGPAGTLMLLFQTDVTDVGIVASWIAPVQYSVAQGATKDGDHFSVNFMADEALGEMHKDCMSAFLLWAQAGIKDPRLCTGADALPTVEALCKCENLLS